MWYTYDNTNLLCLLFSECQDFSDAFCDDCVSGQPACIIEEDLMPTTTASPTTTITTTASPTTTTTDEMKQKLVMVIGGYTAYGRTDDVELVSLDSNPVPDCLSDLNPFPYGGIEESAGAAMASGMKRVCEGNFQ